MFARHLSHFLLALAISLPLTGAPAAHADDQPARAVVELFTSQGCSSCPPADAMLSALADREDVIALAYHVDYWDYAGWEDTFGQRNFSDHQRGYAKSWGSSRIFTPQMVINGADGVVGSKRAAVLTAVANADLPLPVSLNVDSGMLKLSIPAQPGLEDGTIYLVRYLDRAEVAIEKGENAGKTVVYTQVVVDRQAVGIWEAQSGADIKLPLDQLALNQAGGLAVLVQCERHGHPGRILGAAAHDL